MTTVETSSTVVSVGFGAPRRARTPTFTARSYVATLIAIALACTCSCGATSKRTLPLGQPSDVTTRAGARDGYEVQADCRPFRGAADTADVRRPWAVIGHPDGSPATQKDIERLRVEVVEPIVRLIDPDSGVGYGPICTTMGIGIWLTSWHDVDRTIDLLGSIVRFLPYRVEIGIEVHVIGGTP